MRLLVVNIAVNYYHLVRFLVMALLQRIKNNPKHFLLIILTSPVIYGLVVPVIITDLTVTIFQSLCFPAYKIPKVKRRDYLALDRKKLSYLTLVQKFNCLYCDYVNGVFAYASEVAGRTEWYWCPIKHPDNAQRSHQHYDKFIAFGDGEDFAKKHKARRTECRACESDCG